MNELEDILLLVRSELTGLSDYGQVQFSFKKHVGTFGKTDMVKVTNYRYQAKDSEVANADCAADIVKLMRAIQQAEANGSLGFSVTFKKGKAELMQVQDFKKL